MPSARGADGPAELDAGFDFEDGVAADEGDPAGPGGRVEAAVASHLRRSVGSRDDDAVVEYEGVRIDLAHVHEASRLPIIAEARRWIDSGARPPLLTVHADGVDVSTRPDLWPDRVRNYHGPGHIEWVEA